MNFSESVCAGYAGRLLHGLGVDERPAIPTAEHWAVTAARSGLTALTGASEPLHCPVPLAACAEGALAALRALPGGEVLPLALDARLLTERAALRGLTRRGAVAPGGSCRLLPARDGWLAVNLSRADDWELLPAWLEDDAGIAEDDWDALAAALRRHGVAGLVARGRLLGLAVASEAGGEGGGGWLGRGKPGAGAVRRQDRAPLVIDLSTLWAGPLAGHLLHLLGARVVKLESRQRPDGARAGDPDFYNLLNHGKQSLAIDWHGAGDRRLLCDLLERADIVIESSRPRALRQVGIDAEALARRRPGLTWVALSGHGREEPGAQWIAYGDDAGVAAGLSRLMRLAHGAPCFVGDAVADPLAGLHAALAAWAGWCAGGGGLLDIALVNVVRHCIDATGTPDRADALRARAAEAGAACCAAGVAHGLPAARRPAGAAAALGADTPAIAAEFAPC